MITLTRCLINNVQLKDEFSFYTSTAMHSLWMVDRFLSRKSVSRQKLLEVALASIRIASKWSEVHPVTMVLDQVFSGVYFIKNRL